MTLLHIIRPDGTFESQEYTGPLECACPPWDDLAKMIDCHHAEHVNVLWKGKHAHMFVDDVGLAKELPFNARATRIYANATLDRSRALRHRIYSELADDPIVTRPFAVDDGYFNIVGTAVLWEGGFE